MEDDGFWKSLVLQHPSFWYGLFLLHFLETQIFDQAALLCLDGEILAKSDKFRLLTSEAAEMAACALWNKDMEFLAPLLEDQTFSSSWLNERILHVRKTDGSGICCVRSLQTILIGHHPANVREGEALWSLEAYADGLSRTGY